MATTKEIAEKLTTKVFQARGNGKNVEVHLSRAELEKILLVCAELTVDIRPIPCSVAELLKEPKAPGL